MDVHDMCCADLWTNLDKVFRIEYINHLSSFLSLCGPMDSTNQLTIVSQWSIPRIYVVVDGWKHCKRDVWANKLGQATIGAA